MNDDKCGYKTSLTTVQNNSKLLIFNYFLYTTLLIKNMLNCNKVVLQNSFYLPQRMHFLMYYKLCLIFHWKWWFSFVSKKVEKGIERTNVASSHGCIRKTFLLDQITKRFFSWISFTEYFLMIWKWISSMLRTRHFLVPNLILMFALETKLMEMNFYACLQFEYEHQTSYY